MNHRQHLTLLLISAAWLGCSASLGESNTDDAGATRDIVPPRSPRSSADSFLPGDLRRYADSSAPTVTMNAAEWTFIGDDYLKYSGNERPDANRDNWYPNGDPAVVWSSDRVNKLNTLGSTVVKLGFSFPSFISQNSTYCPASIYRQAKMEQAVDVLAQSGIKSILCLMMGWGQGQYYGTQELIDRWVGLASDFANDDRIAALSLFEEPWGDQDADGSNLATTDLTSVGPLMTAAKFHEYTARLIDAIRAVTDTPIIYPYPFLLGYYTEVPPSSTTWSTFHNDLQAAGILSKENIAFDTAHPYMTEYPTFWPNSDSVSYPNALTDGSVNATAWTDKYIEPAVSLFGAERVYVGETFPWGNGCTEGKLGVAPYVFHDAYQIAFASAIINKSIENKVGFCYWGYFSTGCSQQNYDSGIAGSNWSP